MNEIYCGDIRDIAKTLPDQSVNCIVTSPPYFGLRDYQTAKWEGGKAKCDHKVSAVRASDKSTLHNGKGVKDHEKIRNDSVLYRQHCPKCGARRIDKQIGLEETPEAYVNTLVGIFRELKRVLRDDGTIWLNLGDSYANTKVGNTNEAPDKRPRPYFENGTHQMKFKKTIPDGMKPKNLLGIPWRVAFALQADGWILRSDIIWHKKNPMPESVKDRPTKAHEYIFLLSKKPRYYYDNEAVREAHQTWKNINGVMHHTTGGNKIAGKETNRQRSDNILTVAGAHPNGRNRRSVWTVSTRPYKHAHFAVFPPALIRPCILAGCPSDGVVLDPFMGSGTVAQVAIETGRNWLGVELNPEYIELAKERIYQTQPPLPIEAVL